MYVHHTVPPHKLSATDSRTTMVYGVHQSKFFSPLPFFVRCRFRNLPPALKCLLSCILYITALLCSDATHFPGKGYTVSVHYVCKVSSLQRSITPMMVLQVTLPSNMHPFVPHFGFEHILLCSKTYIHTHLKRLMPETLIQLCDKSHVARIRASTEWNYQILP